MFKFKVTKYTYNYEGMYLRTGKTFIRIDGYDVGNRGKLRYSMMNNNSPMNKVEYGVFDVPQFEKMVTTGIYEFEHDLEEVPFKLRDAKPKS